MNSYRILKKADFADCLAVCKTHRTRFELFLALMRMRAAKMDHFPERMYSLLKRFTRPERSLFNGTTAAKIPFIGDIYDLYSVEACTLPVFEPHTLSLLCERLVSITGILIDIGANAGIFSASLSRLGAGDRSLIAFEPLPSTAQRAAATFALNEMENAQIFRVALGEIDGEIKLFEAAESTAYSSAFRADSQDNALAKEWKGHIVPIRKLDSIVSDHNIDRVGLIKIDVEGYELRVLEGALELIKRDRPHIFVEYNPHLMAQAGWRAVDLMEILRKAGPYKLSVLWDDGRLESFPPSSDAICVNIYCEPT